MRTEIVTQPTIIITKNSDPIKDDQNENSDPIKDDQNKK